MSAVVATTTSTLLLIFNASAARLSFVVFNWLGCTNVGHPLPPVSVHAVTSAVVPTSAIPDVVVVAKAGAVPVLIACHCHVERL